MIRIVLDTNVLASGMINPFGAPGKIVDLLREGSIELVVEDRILAEYSEVLKREKFRAYFSFEDAIDIVVFLEQNSHYMVPTIHVPHLPDPDDAPFIETALSAKVPLVTGNSSDYPAKICRPAAILTPSQFVARHAPHR